jgi:hypothetical protein
VVSNQEKLGSLSGRGDAVGVLRCSMRTGQHGRRMGQGNGTRERRGLCQRVTGSMARLEERGQVGEGTVDSEGGRQTRACQVFVKFLLSWTRSSVDGRDMEWPCPVGRG